MQSQLVFPSGHVDYLHDVCYDFYGDRIATCSSDQRIRIFERTAPAAPAAAVAAAFSPSPPSSSSSFPYSCVAELRGHTGSIHRLSWCHPEYGTLLASCSSDRLVLIHEQQKDSAAASSTSASSQRSGYVWKQRGRLSDSRCSVVDCEFAPSHLGLVLATAGIDGRIRLYESRDLMNLSVWGLQDEFSVADAHSLQLPAAPQQPAVGSQGPVVCSALAWDPSPFDPAMLAVACNSSVSVWTAPSASHSKWRCVVPRLEPPHDDQCNDVAWAPNLGRSFHLIATAGKDGNVRIYTLRWDEAKAAWAQAGAGLQLRGHGAQVWRVSFNSSGSLLASTGDDGCTRVWKADYSGAWRGIAQTQTQTQQR